MTRKLPILLLILIIAACSINEQQPHTEDATTIPQPPIPANAPSLRSQPQAKPRQSLAGSIPLTTGWNLISIPELPNDTDPAAVLASIDGSYERVLAYDNCDSAERNGGSPHPWKEYDPDGTSDLTAIDHRSGFWVEMTQNDNLNYDGAAQTGVAIALCQGWNLIGYPLDTAYAAADILAPIRGKYTLLYAHELTDTSDPWAIHSPNIQAWAEPLEDLTLMQPGRGYWLYATENTTLVVDVPTPPTPTPEPTATPVPQPTPTPDPTDTTPPTVSIDTPIEDAELFAPTDIIGTVSDTGLAEWTLEYAPVGESFVVFKTGYGEVIGDVLGQLDTTLQVNGFGRIRLTAIDGSGNEASVIRNVLLSGENKPGNFTLTFRDLSLDLAGIPIEIGRTYDSRQRNIKGDFGFGWSLDVVQRATYRNNRLPGDGWSFGSASPFGCGTASELSTHFTEIRFSNTEFYRFAVEVAGGGYFSGGCTGQVSFTQIGGVPGASLTINGNDVVYWQDGSEELLDFNTFALFQPNSVELTTADGRVYDVHLTRGITSIGDIYGNSLTINQNGVTHSSGLSVTFSRDGQGRITAITDPAGNPMTYSYDGAGDLVIATDRVGNATTFAYDAHLLTEIIDPLGNVGIRNEYDENGRLIAQYDADGNPVTLDVDPDNNSTAATDPYGIITEFEYNDAGQITAIQRGDARYEYTYNADGHRTGMTNPLGDTRTFGYDGDDLVSETNYRGQTYSYVYEGDKLMTMDDPAGGSLEVVYDGEQIAQLVDDNGIVAVSADYHNGDLSAIQTAAHSEGYQFDAFGRIQTITQTNSLTTEYERDLNGNVLQATITRTVDGVTTATTRQTVRDALGRPTAITHSDGFTETFDYDPRGYLTHHVDRRNNATVYQYDARGYLTRTTYCDGTFEAFTYNQLGFRTAATSRGGLTTFFEYNGFGRLQYIVHPDGSAQFFTYDLADNLIRTTDERGFDTTYQYNADGQRTHTTSPLGFTMHAARTHSGQITTQTDPLNHLTTFNYDNANFNLERLIQTVYPDGATRSQTWADNGQIDTMTDELGRVTQFGYDAAGNLVSVTDPLNHVTTYTYDEVGNRLSETDANGNRTGFVYDEFGRLARRTLPLGQTETYTYDAMGNVLTRTDANGATTSYAYDCMGQMTTKTLPDGFVVNYSYDDAGNLASVTDRTGTTTYTHDRRNRITSVTDGNGVTVSYTYDDAGNRTSITDPSGTTHFAYDADNRLTTVTDPDGNATIYTYDAAGNRSSATFANGVTANYTYDNRHRLTNIELRDGANDLLASYAYTLNAAGQRTQLVENTGRTVTYEYDAASRLIREAETFNSITVSTEFGYDATGNLTSVTRNGTTSTYLFDANNRLTALQFADTFSYDANGNLLTFTQNGQTTTYTYDSQNRLTRIDKPNGSVISYTYNAHGRCMSKTVDGTTTRYVWDVAHPSGLPHLIAELDDGNTLQRSYTVGDDLVSLQTGGSRYVYHADGHNNVRLLTDAAGAIVNSYRYDAWGNALSSSETVTQPFRYNEQQLDPNSGFYYLRARFYDPAQRRFISADPFPGLTHDPPSLHKYLYSRNDPVNLSDPSGLFFGSAAQLFTIVSATELLQAVGVPSIRERFESAWDSYQNLGEVSDALAEMKLNEEWGGEFLNLAFTDDYEVDVATQFGSGATGLAYDKLASFGGRFGKAVVHSFRWPVLVWFANLPAVDAKPAHFQVCDYNKDVYRLAHMEVAQPLLPPNVKQVLTFWNSYYHYIALLAYTNTIAATYEVPVQPVDGWCSNFTPSGQ